MNTSFPSCYCCGVFYSVFCLLQSQNGSLLTYVHQSTTKSRIGHRNRPIRVHWSVQRTIERLLFFNVCIHFESMPFSVLWCVLVHWKYMLFVSWSWRRLLGQWYLHLRLYSLYDHKEILLIVLSRQGSITKSTSHLHLLLCISCLSMFLFLFSIHIPKASYSLYCSLLNFWVCFSFISLIP